MHDHMTLHAHSNPLPSHSRPSDASERSGGYDKAKTGDCPGAAPSLQC